MSEFDYLNTAFQAIRIAADGQGIKLHESFFVELENYSLHRKVRDHDRSELADAIRDLGELVLRKDPDEAGGGHVRELILQLCGDPFRDCHNALEKILEAPSMDALLQQLRTE